MGSPLVQIKPLGRTTLKPAVLLVPKWRELTAYTEAGVLKASGAVNCFKLLEKLESCTLYVSSSLRDLLLTTGSQYWQAELWKGHVTSMSLDGTKVKVNSLRRILDAVGADETRFSSMLEMLGWLREHGVPPGSISGMAWSLWRSTLEKPFTLAFDGDIGREAFYGGRQEATPGIYKDMLALDISSAYPFEMASRPYAGTLREVSTRTELDPLRAGLAVARVRIPDDLPHSPLPVRLSEDLIQWRKGEISGSWTWQELDAAKRLGCEVSILRNYAPLTEVDPFSNWWDVVREGRKKLTPPAAKLVKSLSNSLWGMFAMSGDNRGLVRWTDDYGNDQEIIPRNARKLPQANTAHIAAETTSRVRVRMLLEGLYGGLDLAPNFPAHIDTDGLLIPSASIAHFSQNMIGEKSGQWRVKARMIKLEVRAPQLYRSTCSTSCVKDHAWHYVAAGMTEKRARDYFANKDQSFKMTIGKGSQGMNNFELERELAQLEARKLNSRPE